MCALRPGRAAAAARGAQRDRATPPPVPPPFSTRPFLTEVEHRWFAYQVLRALEQLHEAGLAHGDIKTENVLVTSWGWLLLSDMAPHKPVYLPDDNPAGAPARARRASAARAITALA